MDTELQKKNEEFWFDFWGKNPDCFIEHYFNIKLNKFQKWLIKKQYWKNENNILPPKDRGKIRSRTFPGIAKAMAEQWTKYLKNNP